MTILASTDAATALVIVSVSLSLPHLCRAQAAEGGALGKDVWSPLAKFTQTAAKVTGRAMTLIRERTNHITKLETQLSQARLYLQLKADSSKQLAWTALISAMSSDLEALQDTQVQRISDGLAAAAATEFARGHAAEFFKVAVKAYNSPTQGCLTTANANAVAGNVISSFDSVAPEEKPSIDPTTTADVSTDVAGISAQGFTELAATNGIRTSALTADAKCTLFKGGTAGPLDGVAWAGKIPFAGGYLSRDTAAATNSEADGRDFTTDPSAQAVAGIKVYQHAFTAAAKIRDGRNFKGTLIDYTKHASLKESAALRRTTAALLLNKTDADDLSALKADIDSKIDSVFGANQAEYDNRFWGKLKEVTIEKIASGIDSCPLNDIRSIAAMNRAASYYFVTATNEIRAKIAALEAKGPKPEHQFTDQDCSRRLTTDKCTAPCKWEENAGDKSKGTCKLDPKKAAEQPATENNDGKTTNTTGSNSFVINKAPLWLAFLLF